MDSGAACRAWPCRVKTWFFPRRDVLTATGAPVESRGTMEVKFQLVDAHGEKIFVRAIFELLLVRCHKSNGVYHVRASALSELCPLENQEPRNDAGPPAEAVGEAAAPWTRRLPYKPTDDERMSHSVSHLPFHRSDDGSPPDIPMVAMDSCFVNTESDDDVLTILAMKKKPFQSVGATVLPDKSASEFVVAAIIGYLDFSGHQEDMIKCDTFHSRTRVVCYRVSTAVAYTFAGPLSLKQNGVFTYHTTSGCTAWHTAHSPHIGSGAGYRSFR